MKREKSPKIMYIILLLMMLLLLFNSILLARTAGFIQFPGEMTRKELAREGAAILIDYYEKMAKDAKVLENKAVREAIAQFKYEIERASTPQDLARLQTIYSRRVQEVIAREQDTKRREEVLSIIKNDPGISVFNGDAVITVSKEQEEIKVTDPTGLITEETVKKLNESPILDDSWSIIEISVRQGQPTLQTTRSLIDQLNLREKELADLKSKITQLEIKSGYAEMTGPGVIVELYDSNNGFSSVDIVHDRDVRDVVNELFSAGATGIAVGGHRLTATSSIRCAGPIILVNQQPIAVDPIVIQAVGDPEVLKSSLKLIKGELQEFGIKVEITPQEQITLPAYKEKK
ncbi:MAG: uncharacterized protein JG764_434 [Clostridiales bacterium]|nr:uncharacterized protein [Clostridiales bacterium]